MWDEDDDEGDFPSTRRFRPLDALVLAAGLPREILRAVADWLDDVMILVALHGKWKLEQETPVKVTR